MQGFSLLFDVAAFRQQGIDAYGATVCQMLFDGLERVSFSGTVTMWTTNFTEDDQYLVLVQLKGSFMSEHDLQGIFSQPGCRILGTVAFDEHFRKGSPETCRGTVQLEKGLVTAIVRKKDFWFTGEALGRLCPIPPTVPR